MKSSRRLSAAQNATNSFSKMTSLTSVQPSTSVEPTPQANPFANPKTTIAVIDLSANHICSQAGTQIDIAMRRFGGMTLLEWCVRRLSESTLLDQIIVTGLPSYQRQVQSVGLCGASWMPSLESNSFDRISQVAERTQASWIALVSPTCPFLDAALLDRLISSAWSHPEADFVAFMSTKNHHFDAARFGLIGEVFHGNALTLTRDRKLDTANGLTGTIKSHPNVFHSRFVPLPALLDREDLQFALETPKDWEQAYLYFDACGEDITWQRLVEMSILEGA